MAAEEHRMFVDAHKYILQQKEAEDYPFDDSLAPSGYDKAVAPIDDLLKKLQGLIGAAGGSRLAQIAAKPATDRYERDILNPAKALARGGKKMPHPFVSAASKYVKPSGK
jgi:hypothetical protein